jgi:hypothetical protein
MFSKDGPNLNNPAETNRPNVTPKIYKLKKRRKRGSPRSRIEIPNKGDVSNIAGTRPIKALIKAVAIRDMIISLILIGAINKFVKFLLQISSRKSILKPMLVLNKKS